DATAAPVVTSAPTEKPSAYTTLKYGDTGEAVKALQRKLKELGYFTGNIGGNYLTLTQSAVEAYQQANGLTVDGIATSQLQERIFATQSGAQSTPSPAATTAPQPTEAPTSAPQPTDVPQKEVTAYVTLGNSAGRLNVRAAPSTSAAILGRLANGTAVTVTGTNGSWSAVRAEGISGYVASEYLRGVKPETPVVPATPQATAEAKPTAAPQPAATQKPADAASASGYTTLRPGDTGEAVKALQRKLKELGYFTGNIGGNYLTLTEGAVKAFQQANGLTADGIATTELQKKIFGAATSGSAASSENATVQLGSDTYLNLRASASATSNRLAQMYNGARVTVLGEEGEWYKLSYNGQTGYALKEYIRKD
ncbi:MAG: peptidoglycan-binding protein, partial [Clostridia bacterium]|nr:peptidoglycan-binding protein [Clostridia bacterium]